ncbi:MAG TPA: acylphosphatase [Nitrospira sp.]|nr:acylphosphatase [Nitrospira sp.]
MTDARDSPVRARISVSGRVQGVGYRAFTVRAATERGLVGGVRNCEDGRVELEAEGPQDQIMSLIAALKVGPPASRVTDVRVEWVSATGRHTDFAIWY